MKILQVNKLYYPWIGGVETIVQQIAEGLRTRINADQDADQRGYDRTRINADQDADQRGYDRTRINADQDADQRGYDRTRINADQDADQRGYNNTRINADQDADQRGYDRTRINADQDADQRGYNNTRINADQDADQRGYDRTRINADQDADQRGYNNTRSNAEMGGLLYEELTYKIRGAIFNVYNKLGPGHKEKVYQNALEEELQKIGLSFQREKEAEVVYEGKTIGCYKPDFIVEDKIIVEIKASPFLSKIEKSQVWTYLKGSEYRLALLVNFGAPKLQIERIIYDSARSNNQHESALISPQSASNHNPRKSASLSIDVLVCNDKNKRVFEKVNNVNVFRAKTLAIILGMPVSFDFFFLYRKLVRNYDLVFLHYPFPLAFVAYTLFSPKKNLVIWYHSDIVRQKILELFFRSFHLFCFERAKKILVSNPNLMKSSKNLRKFKDKCKVIPFGVDLSRFSVDEEIQKKAQEIREKFGSPLILSVGRLTYYKGFDYLIQAMKDITAKLLIIGDGKRKKKLLNLIQNLNLDQKVFLLPPVKDLRPYYLACDIFVLPSIAKSEAFGIVLLEAMSYGKPVISTELGTGTSWVNIDSETGLVVLPKSVQELKKAIERLLADEELYQGCSEKAKQRAKELSLAKFLFTLENELLSL